ncbi:hypothetical protein QV65_16030, partial [Rhodococcus erythropolis]
AGDALTLPELLLRGAADPHAPAIVDVAASATLTYGELDRRSDAMAFALIARGIAPEMIVALALPRSADYVIALWAVAKAGGVFLPVDPAYPAERIEHMLTDSGAVLGITRGEYVAGFRAPRRGSSSTRSNSPPKSRQPIPRHCRTRHSSSTTRPT